MQGANADPAAPARRPTYLRFLSLGVSGILMIVGAIVMYRWVSGPEILAMLKRTNWHWFIPAVFAYWLQIPISAIRIQRIIAWLTPSGIRPPPFRLILKVTLSGAFIAVTAPIGLMADAAKIGAFKYFGHMSTSQAIRCTLFDRLVAAQWMSLFALASLPLQCDFGVPPSAIGIQFLVAAGFMGAIVLMLCLPMALKIFDHKFVLRFANLLTGYEITFPLRRLAVQIVITAVNLVLIFVTLYCLLRAIGLEANLVVIACFIPFLQLVNGVPFLYMGWGGREIAMAATVGVASGLSINQALVLSAIWGLTLIIAGAVNGVFVLGDWHSHRAAANPLRPPVV